MLAALQSQYSREAGWEWLSREFALCKLLYGGGEALSLPGLPWPGLDP